MEKSPEAFRTISEVAESLDLPQHVLRFWETRFPQIRPLKRAGGRRYYRPEDVDRIGLIKRLLYDEGYTIKGVQKLFKEQGATALAREPRGAQALDSDAPPAAPRDESLEPPRVEPPPRFAPAPGPRLAEDDAAMLRRALADLAEAERILAQALAPRA